MMLVLVSYDVSTTDKAGQRRLRRIARACLDYGQRVQFSVFECVVDGEQWAKLKYRLLRAFDPSTDSLRFYYLGARYDHKVEHHGAKPVKDLTGTLVV